MLRKFSSFDGVSEACLHFSCLGVIFFVFTPRFDIEFSGLKLSFYHSFSLLLNAAAVATRYVCWASCYMCWGDLKCCMRFCFHLLILKVGGKIQYNPELFFLSLFFTNIASLFFYFSGETRNTGRNGYLWWRFKSNANESKKKAFDCERKMNFNYGTRWVEMQCSLYAPRLIITWLLHRNALEAIDICGNSHKN